MNLLLQVTIRVDRAYKSNIRVSSQSSENGFEGFKVMELLLAIAILVHSSLVLGDDAVMSGFNVLGDDALVFQVP